MYKNIFRICLLFFFFVLFKKQQQRNESERYVLVPDCKQNIKLKLNVDYWVLRCAYYIVSAISDTTWQLIVRKQ